MRRDRKAILKQLKRLEQYLRSLDDVQSVITGLKTLKARGDRTRMLLSSGKRDRHNERLDSGEASFRRRNGAPLIPIEVLTMTTLMVVVLVRGQTYQIRAANFTEYVLRHASPLIPPPPQGDSPISSIRVPPVVARGRSPLTSWWEVRETPSGRALG